jgi:hypothetical protein
MTNDNEEQMRLLLARQFTIGVDYNNRVLMKFDYKNLPKDTNEYQLGLSLPIETARALAQQILEAADKAEASSKAH